MIKTGIGVIVGGGEGRQYFVEDVFDETLRDPCIEQGECRTAEFPMPTSEDDVRLCGECTNCFTQLWSQHNAA